MSAAGGVAARPAGSLRAPGGRAAPHPPCQGSPGSRRLSAPRHTGQPGGSSRPAPSTRCHTAPPQNQGGPPPPEGRRTEVGGRLLGRAGAVRGSLGLLHTLPTSRRQSEGSWKDLMEKRLRLIPRRAAQGRPPGMVLLGPCTWLAVTSPCKGAPGLPPPCQVRLSGQSTIFSWAWRVLPALPPAGQLSCGRDEC